jgi:hypothetical protein
MDIKITFETDVNPSVFETEEYKRWLRETAEDIGKTPGQVDRLCKDAVHVFRYVRKYGEKAALHRAQGSIETELPRSLHECLKKTQRDLSFPSDKWNRLARMTNEKFVARNNTWRVLGLRTDLRPSNKLIGLAKFSGESDPVAAAARWKTNDDVVTVERKLRRAMATGIFSPKQARHIADEMGIIGWV